MFDNKNKKDNLELILDIRNSSVGIAVIEKNKIRPIISYTDRQYLLFEKKQSTNDFIKNIYKTISQVIERVHQSNIIPSNKIEKVTCIFSSPWYEAEIKNIKFEEKRKAVFTKEYLNKKIEETLSKNLLKDREVIENKILSVYLNGYEVLDPFNKKFNESRISLYRGIIGKKTKKDIENLIEGRFKINEIVFHTHPLSIISVLRKNFHSVDNFTLFDIGGEVTEVSIFKEGIFKEIITLPEGFNFLIRELSSKTSSGKNSTFSKIKLITEGEIKDSNLEKEIVEVAKKWFSELQNNLKNKVDKIPTNFFVTVDKDFKNSVNYIFKNKEFYTKTLMLNKEPIIRIINSENTQDLAFYKKDVEKDALLSVFYNFSTIDFK